MKYLRVTINDKVTQEIPIHILQQYKCVVCYHLSSEPIGQFDICPCCGTQFGYDDCTLSHEELRERWLQAKSKWWSETTPDDRKRNL